MAGLEDAGRKAGELNQHGCSMTGFAFQIMDLTGPDFAVVIFGERDCVSAFPRISSEFASQPAWNVYSVALRESDVVAGRASERLRECLVAVAASMRPPVVEQPVVQGATVVVQSIARHPSPVIVVLSTCMSEMTGAVAEQVCRQVQEGSGVRIIPVATSGLRLRTQAEIVDHVAAVLLDAFGDFGTVDPAGVNLIGYQTDRFSQAAEAGTMFPDEASLLISAFGGRLNSAVAAGASVSDWRNLPRGGLNVLVDRSLVGGLARLLEGQGRRFVQLAQPKGVAASDSFYAAIAREIGSNAWPVLENFQPRLDAIQAVARARARFSGMRLAYGIGTIHNFRPDVLAREGLDNLPLFLELGFDVEIVIQERDYPEVHRRIRRNLELLGVDAPYRLYYEPAVLEPALREGRYDCAYVADFMRDQVNRAGIPMLRLGEMNSGYRLAEKYIGRIEETLGAVFDRRFGRYFH